MAKRGLYSRLNIAKESDLLNLTKRVDGLEKTQEQNMYISMGVMGASMVLSIIGLVKKSNVTVKSIPIGAELPPVPPVSPVKVDIADDFEEEFDDDIASEN